MLDDAYAYQPGRAPSWFEAKEKLDRRSRENQRRARLRPNPTPTPTPISEKDAEAIEKPEATVRVEAVGSVAKAAIQGGSSSEVDQIDKKQTQLDESAWWDGGAKKKSFRSWVGRIVRRTQDRLAKRGLDKTSGA
jgi:hypothetical protein